MSSLEFEDTSYEQLQTWISSGKVKNMPDELIGYLQALELVRSMYDKYTQKKFIIRTLSLPPWNLSEYKAQKIFTDALNFFYADNAVKREAWANVYAEKFDKLATLAIKDNDWQTAQKCLAEASKLRMGKENANNIPRQLLDRRPIFYTIKPKQLGLPEANRSKLAAFIDSLEDIPNDDRMRMHREAQTEKAEGNVFDVEVSDIEFLDGK